VRGVPDQCGVGFLLIVEVDYCRREVWDVLLMLMCVGECGVDERGCGRQHRDDVVSK